MKNNENYYIGLDIGTNDVGYAVTDTTENYNLLKYKGEPMWGVTLFDEASLSQDRRAFRTARRRLDRRQQRVKLVQEIFAHEIAKVDEKFYTRIKESALLRTDANEPFCLFNDNGFTDKDYHKKYPTTHHLITELITNKEPHDVRLVYIACAWLVAHRGHFLSDISENNIDSMLDFKNVYGELMEYLQNSVEENYVEPWQLDGENINALGELLKKDYGITRKYNAVCDFLLKNGGKPQKKAVDGFPFSADTIIGLLCGKKCKPADLFCNAEYDEVPSFALSSDDETLDSVLKELGDDAELVIRLKAIYDWSVLVGILGDFKYISQSKVEIYEQHKKDLAQLKKYVKENCRGKYDELFRSLTENSYSAYSGNAKSLNSDELKKCKSQEAFCDYLKTVLGLKNSKEIPANMPEDMYRRISDNKFMPKQVNGDNRTIPYQVYFIELKRILENASSYLPFLTEADDNGYINLDKLLSIMKFRVPYFVGPLNKVNNEHAWIERKAEGKIYPWNFEELVDLEKSEEKFIDKMTNSCSYIAGEDCLPKNSLLYEKFTVLNEINNLKLNGERISPEAKQQLFENLFGKRKKVTVKQIKAELCALNYCSKEEAEELSGVDTDIKSSLKSRLSFSRLLESGTLTEADVEEIITRITYTEDKRRIEKWVKNKYPQLSSDDAKYISGLKLKDFGRLSKKLLNGILGANVKTGEANTVIGFMWERNENLSEILLSDKYTFKEQIEKMNREYYSEKKLSLNDKLGKMYISNAVKRPIIRTLDIVSDIVKATGKAPEKIFVEMARGASQEQKNKRTTSRREQLLNLYSKIKNEDIRELKEQLDSKTDNDLQSDKLFLYFTQLGKCMYSGKSIDIERIGSDKLYDVDHIYPQAFVKDDSILNNKVLVLSEENGKKGDIYPIASDIRSKMHAHWVMLKEKGLITDAKFKRLTRNTGFSEDEKWGFINRQLVETRQSTKAVAELLNEKYPDTKIVYVKAGLVSGFRHDFDMLKSRAVNDLHHAKDAYLNIVCGNTYNEKFTEKWFLNNKNSKYYSANPKTLFKHTVESNGKTIWNPKTSFKSVRMNVHSNNVHLTAYSFCRHGGYFDQMPLKKSEGLVPRKIGLATELYGGYNKASNSYFMLVKYSAGKKGDIIVMPVELLYSQKIENGSLTYEEYAKDRIGRIIGKEITSVSFPLGYRKIKINTLISLDGFKGVISGSSNGGKQLLISSLMPLKLGFDFEKYVKHIESFADKCSKNKNLVYNEHFDKINKEKNLALYDIFCNKHNSSLYAKRPNSPADILKNGRDKFISLETKEQAFVLLNILQTFGRISGGIDLQSVGGSKKSGVSIISTNLSNWTKKYKTAFLLDASASGIWEQKSENLLDLL